MLVAWSAARSRLRLTMMAFECLLGDFGVLGHDLDEVGVDGAVHVVDFVIHFENGFGELVVGLEEGLDGGADHDAHFGAHVFYVDGEGRGWV